MVTRRKDKNGYSLLELVVSMVLISIVISSVYLFWRYMNNHVITHSNHALLQKESDRLIHLVANAIRRSTAVLHYSDNSITFLGGSEDTVTYSFSDDTLYKNRIPVTILMDRSKVKNFEIRNLHDDPLDSSPHRFLEFTITLVNHGGVESKAGLTVRTKRPLQESDPAIGW